METLVQLGAWDVCIGDRVALQLLKECDLMIEFV